MIHGKYIPQGADLSAITRIRSNIFQTEELKKYDLHEELDAMALNAVIDIDGKEIGTGRLVLDIIEDRFYVDNIGIYEEERGHMYGEFTLRMLVDKANQCNAKEVWAEVPDFAKGFFTKLFFEEVAVNGDLTLMKAPIDKFHSCCSHSAESCPKGLDDCSTCGGCGEEN